MKLYITGAKNSGSVVMTFPGKEYLFGATVSNELATQTGVLINQTILITTKTVVYLAGLVSPLVNGTTGNVMITQLKI